MKKKIIIITIIILLVGIIGIKEISKKGNNILQEVKVKDSFPNKDKTLSIMIEQDGGEYKEDTNRTSWPDQETYQYEKAECTDGDGTEVPSEGIITFSENNIHVKTKNTIYCTLYFRIKPNEVTGAILIANRTTNDALQDEPVNGLYRYYGSDTDVQNNYICFGTTDQNICKEDKEQYMYRIIGITDNSSSSTNLTLKEG